MDFVGFRRSGNHKLETFSESFGESQQRPREIPQVLAAGRSCQRQNERASNAQVKEFAARPGGQRHRTVRGFERRAAAQTTQWTRSARKPKSLKQSDRVVSEGT